jgi:hypothetical protein
MIEIAGLEVLYMARIHGPRILFRQQEHAGSKAVVAG